MDVGKSELAHLPTHPPMYPHTHTLTHRLSLESEGSLKDFVDEDDEEGEEGGEGEAGGDWRAELRSVLGGCAACP